MISILSFNQNSSALVRFMRLILFLLVVISTSCSKEFINPYDPATRADEWMPRNLNIDTVDLGTLRISWTQDIKHIDGYFLRKTINGWPTVIELPGEATSYIDTVINSLEGELRYSLRAKAGNRLSDSIVSEEVVAVPLLGLRDIDGNYYKIVSIGDQVWMAENLKTTRFSDGQPIEDNPVPYNSNSYNDSVYGKLYKWPVTIDLRNVCPAGWHVPTEDEVWQLINHLGDQFTGGGKIKTEGTDFWMSPNIAATNESGFSALPGGFQSSINGTFQSLGYSAYFWTSSVQSSESAKFFNVNHWNSVIEISDGLQNAGFSIRCLKNQ